MWLDLGESWSSKNLFQLSFFVVVLWLNGKVSYLFEVQFLFIGLFHLLIYLRFHLYVVSVLAICKLCSFLWVELCFIVLFVLAGWIWNWYCCVSQHSSKSVILCDATSSFLFFGWHILSQIFPCFEDNFRRFLLASKPHWLMQLFRFLPDSKLVYFGKVCLHCITGSCNSVHFTHFFHYFVMPFLFLTLPERMYAPPIFWTFEYKMALVHRRWLKIFRVYYDWVFFHLSLLNGLLCEWSFSIFYRSAPRAMVEFMCDISSWFYLIFS